LTQWKSQALKGQKAKYIDFCFLGNLNHNEEI